MTVMVFLALCFILAQTSSGVDSAGCEYYCIVFFMSSLLFDHEEITLISASYKIQCFSNLSHSTYLMEAIQHSLVEFVILMLFGK